MFRFAQHDIELGGEDASFILQVLNGPAFLRNLEDRRVRGSVARGIWVIFGRSSRTLRFFGSA